MSGEWLTPGRPDAAAALTLVCFPYAGMGASVYRAWSRALPPAVEVRTVQLPGREARWNEPPLQRIGAMVDGLMPTLARELRRPFAFFGHSLGGLVATEVVAELDRRGATPPVHLFVSSRRAPDVPDPDPPMSGLDDDAFVAEIQRRYGGIPPEVLRDAEMMALVLPGLRADIAALEAHPRRDDLRIRCPLTVFGGDADPRVPPPHLEAWRGFAGGGFRLRIFPGDHFYLGPCRDALVADVVATLAPAMDSLAARTGAERAE